MTTYRIHHVHGQAGNAATHREHTTLVGAIAAVRDFCPVHTYLATSSDGGTTYVDEDPDLIEAEDVAVRAAWAISAVAA